MVIIIGWIIIVATQFWKTSPLNFMARTTDRLVYYIF